MRIFLAKYCPGVSVVGEADGVASGVQQIKALEPQAILLDIGMKDGSGFDLLGFFPHPWFRVIFTTAYDEFALQAFKFNALDYLLKPVDPVELVTAIEKVEEGTMHDYRNRLSNMMANARSRQFDKIALHTQEGIIFIRLTEIVHIEADGNYTTFSLAGGERFVACRALKEFEEMLPKDTFFRTHQSHIVNIDFIRKFLKEEGGCALLENGTKVEISRRRKEDFLALLSRRSMF